MLVQDVIKKIQDDIASINRRISSISGGSAIDHGTLSGLADDDHVQYLLADGSRNLSSYIDIDEIADPGAPAAGDVRFFAHDEHLISLGEDDTWYDLSSGAFSASSHVHAVITVTDKGGLNITWSAGEVFDAFISGGNQMVDTTAEPVNQAQTPNTMNWLFYDQTAGDLDNSANEDDIKWAEGDFPVAAIGCSPTDILALHHFPLGNREMHNIKRVLFTALDAVVKDGLVVSEHAGGGAFDVDLSAGTFVHLGIDVHTVSAIDSTATNIIRWFHDAADNWATDTNAQIDAANWDDPTDGAGIQPNTNSKYYRSIFYTDGTYIHWLYPQEEFNTLAQAIAGDDPEPPDYLAHFPSCTVVVMKGDDAAFPAAGSDQWIDVRPTLGGAKIGGVVTDHGGLSGLGDDDHTQYLLASGARAMAGNLNMGGNNITNVGDITANHLALGGASIDSDIGLNFTEVLTDTDNSPKYGIYSVLQAAKTAAVMTSIAYGQLGRVILDSTNTQNWTHPIALQGFQGSIYTEAGSTGTITGAAGLVSYANLADAATVTNFYGLYVAAPSVAGNKLINNYGIYVSTQNKGLTLNYAIYTNTGLIRFGDSIFCTGLKSGANQAAAGAAANELYHDTDDNTIKIGV